MTEQKLSRQDHIYIIARTLKERGLGPQSNLYKGAIIRICAANFQLAKPKVDEITRILTTAYHTDRWNSILGETTPPPQEENEIPTINLTKLTKNNAATLKAMAKRDTFDNVGRLIMSEIKLELGYNTPQEVIDAWETYNPKDNIEQTGNIFKIYWGGKTNVQEERGTRAPTVNMPKPTLFARLEYKPEVFEKETMADKTNDGVGEVNEDLDGVIEEEDSGEE